MAVKVEWKIESPVVFGKVAYLICRISDQVHNCSRRLRQWLGGQHYGSLCYNNKCNISLSKYNVMNETTMCLYTLMIGNFSEHDVNCEYTCSYGVSRMRKNLTLDTMAFRCKYNILDIFN